MSRSLDMPPSTTNDGIPRRVLIDAVSFGDLSERRPLRSLSAHCAHVCFLEDACWGSAPFSGAVDALIVLRLSRNLRCGAVRGRNVRPVCPRKDRIDRRLRDPILSCNFSLRNPRRRFFPYLGDISDRQLSVTALFAADIHPPPFFVHVDVIIVHGAEEQMRGVAARWIVACVADLERPSDWPVCEDPHEPACSEASAIPESVSIAASPAPSLPRPTRLWAARPINRIPNVSVVLTHGKEPRPDRALVMDSAHTPDLCSVHTTVLRAALARPPGDTYDLLSHGGSLSSRSGQERRVVASDRRSAFIPRRAFGHKQRSVA